jgi:hypothetical protein
MKFNRTDAIPELLLVGRKVTIMSAQPNKFRKYKIQKIKNRTLLTWIKIPLIEIAVTTKLVNIEMLIYNIKNER